MSDDALRVGLVLSGGGAKGAYEAGALRALHESGFEISVVSGASIGALNAAVISAAPSQTVAVERVWGIWERLRHVDPIFDDARVPYLQLLAAAGATFNPVLRKLVLLAIKAGAIPSDIRDACNITDQKIRQMISEVCDPKLIGTRVPCFVSVYPALEDWSEILEVAAAALLGINTRDSEVFEVATLPPEQRLDAVLASAAIPLLFKPKKIGGREYVDGGCGDWFGSTGNTPAQAITSKCDLLFVIHLQSGSLWSRHEVDATTSVVEVRPRQIERKGFLDLIAFKNEDAIDAWMQQGYEETLETVAGIGAHLEAVAKNRRARSYRRQAEEDLRRIVDDHLNRPEFPGGSVS